MPLFLLPSKCAFALSSCVGVLISSVVNRMGLDCDAGVSISLATAGRCYRIGPLVA